MLEVLCNGDWVTSLLAVACGICFFLWWYLQQPENLPPGPRGFPIVGNLFTFMKNARTGKIPEYIVSLHEKYGPIITIRVGVQKFILIKDGELVTELFKDEEFAFRPVETLPILTKVAHGSPRGLIFSNGEGNKEMRRFALASLRDFGVGKSTLDEIVEAEGSVLCQALEDAAKNSDGVLSELKIKIQFAAANIIHHIAFGHRHEYDDPKWKELVQKLFDFFAVNPLGFPENFFPILGKFPRINRLLTRNMDVKFMSINSDLEAYIQSQIDDHRTTYCEGEIRDFIDFYIKYESESREHYTKENIFATILDLFRAGTETTATTLTWAIMFLARFPKIQQQLQDEVAEVIGDSVFKRKEKEKLVKTRAFMNEIHRYVSVAPLSGPHTPQTPKTVRGYTFPAHSLVQASLYAMHHDKQYWKNPYEFSINRWIDENGDLMRHEDHFMPFSIGKRFCPGRQLANIEVIIILVQILRKYNFEPAEGHSDLTDEQHHGGIRAPKNFHLKIVKR